MTAALPNWVIDLVNALADHEDSHGSVHDDGNEWACVDHILKIVPDEVRTNAAAINSYVLQRDRATKDVP